jgi:hypothetical protein
MPNLYLPRTWVHETSDMVGQTAVEQQAALQRLLKEQRRLTRWLEENASNLKGQSPGVAVYLFGAVARIFDLTGGELRKATWEQLRDAEKRVGSVLGGLLPFDDGFPERVRQVSWRAQPHLLDEALMTLFMNAPDEQEVALDKTEAGKIFAMMWVAIEVMDQNWKPGKGIVLESTYTYQHIEPKKA